MATIRQQIQQYLRDFNFKHLFVNELGWDHLNEPPLTIPCDNQIYTLRPLVEKRGVKVYVCDPDTQGKIPADPILRKIEREATRHTYEHFNTYVDDSHIDDDQLASLVINLREDNRLCQVHDQTEPEEPQIICSLGLFEGEDGI